jgi:hypothetical protein
MMGTRATSSGETQRWDMRPHASLPPTLRSRLSAWEALTFGDPLGAHHRGHLAAYLAGLRMLAGSESDRSSAALLAALALGPRTAIPGDLGPVGPLLDVAGRTEVDVVDLAVAWGCGWGRVVSPGHAWRGRWDAALLSLCSLTERSVARTLRWLADNISGLGTTLRAAGPDEHRCRLVTYANQIAMELSLGAPAGKPARPALVNWRPDDCRFSAFVANAVRGSAQLPLRGGAFAASMLAALLREDHLLRVDVAEFSVCHACNPELIVQAPRRRGIELSTVRRGLHDLARCPDCGAPPHPAHTYRLARKNWLIVPADWGGRYEAVHRHRCPGCGNLFPAGHERCPLCLCPASPGRRLTSLWLRGTGP